MASNTQRISTPLSTPQQRHFSTPPSSTDSPATSFNSRNSLQTMPKSNRLSTPSSLSNRLSLTSSRPAPPSPAVSRRTSTALSSIPAATSRPNSLEKRGSLLPLTPTAPDTPTSGTTDPTSLSARRSIQIRDYAFRVSISDPRALGLGEDVPKPNRVRLLNRKLLGEQGWRIWRKKKREETKRARGSVGSISSVASSQRSEDDWEDEDVPISDSDEDDEDVSGWGNFEENDRSALTTPDDEGMPSALLFLPRRPHYRVQNNPYDYYPEEQNSGELRPGLYRALFDFEPEGADEMALQEDQVVRVIGRGGDGWAVVLMDSGAADGENTAQSQKHALVPEGYLEAVELDV
ncbi:hypothetical protein PQX77_022225 [Marasmius sp. AFHP31]|nr:hypothetical protein PQX77_022225 [Marasmius sp. AFHP31]